MKVAILGLSDLSNAMWTNFQINVTISGQHKYVLVVYVCVNDHFKSLSFSGVNLSLNWC